MARRAQITLVRSPIGRKPTHRQTVRRLGFTKLNQTKEHELTPQILGMIDQVGYLLEVKEA